MIRTYKRKLILTKAQEERINSWIGACRTVYNLGLEIRIAAYRNKGKSVSRYELQGQLKGLRADIPWIKDTPFEILTTTILRLHNAYESFFRRGLGFPKFATKKDFKSIWFPTLKVEGDFIRLQKIGRMKMFKDSEIKGNPKNAHLIKEPTGYFICIQCENVPAKFESESQAIGLDVGISHFVVDSNGGFIANPKHFKRHERRLRIENRSLARKKKGSKSWVKQAKRVSRLYHTIGNVRRDFLHKESTRIAKANATVYMEDLNISGMVRNRKLSKHILDAGWGMFREMLSYKTKVVLVDPKHTSQACNECGAVDTKSRISQSEFACTSCGHIANADVNAARNILSRGAALAR